MVREVFFTVSITGRRGEFAVRSLTFYYRHRPALNIPFTRFQQTLHTGPTQGVFAQSFFLFAYHGAATSEVHINIYCRSIIKLYLLELEQKVISEC